MIAHHRLLSQNVGLTELQAFLSLPSIKTSIFSYCVELISTLPLLSKLSQQRDSMAAETESECPPPTLQPYPIVPQDSPQTSTPPRRLLWSSLPHYHLQVGLGSLGVLSMSSQWSLCVVNVYFFHFLPSKTKSSRAIYLWIPRPQCGIRPRVSGYKHSLVQSTELKGGQLILGFNLGSIKY